MSEEEKKAINDLIDIKEFGNLSSYLDLRKEQLKSIDIALNLIEKQQKEIKELKSFKKQVEDIEYTNFVKYKNYISKDKIRDILLKFQNKYSPYLETTGRLFIGKEVVQYGEDILDEMAKELDIELLEEE